MLNSVLVPIHRKGWPFIAIFAAATFGLFLIGAPLGWLGVILTSWCVYFFRDPDRTTPVREGLIISPADGVVILTDEVPPPPELDMGDAPRRRVAVFMNVFNVHVNRVPCEGVVSGLHYHPGKFFNASLDKASIYNERQSLKITLPEHIKVPDDKSRDIAFVQIAGLVARRIVCEVIEGQTVKTGERFGLIRFGSRVDTYLPLGVQPLVTVGQTTIAGETVIADMSASEAIRQGEVR